MCLEVISIINSKGMEQTYNNTAMKDNSKQLLNMKERNSPCYPVIDVCYTSRGQVGMDVKEPLLKYTRLISSSQSQFHNEKLDFSDFKTLDKEDGMINFYRDMMKDRSQQNKRTYTDSKNKTHYYGPKVLIVVCMYNEGIGAINITLKGIYKNLKKLKKEGIAPEQIAVVLIQDGILKLMADRNRRTYAKSDLSIIEFAKLLDQHQGKQYCDLQVRLHTILDSIDDFKRKQQQHLISKNNDFPPNIEKQLAVLYQNQWKPQYTDKQYAEEKKRVQNQKMSNSSEGNFMDDEDDIKLNIFTCFKHMNGKKLHSHLWFFQGFCRYLVPEFVVLLDVGTTPGYKKQHGYDGLSNLIRGFYAGKDVGGVTGLMSIDSNFPSLEGEDNDSNNKPNPIVDCLFSIQKAQEYEYIMAHFLDKNFESSTGFLHVLPGAWSAYRYIALIKSEKYEENLLQKSYFTPILNPDMERTSGYEEQNMYLAEDRILSLGIYCQPKSKYTLMYVPDGVAFTDPMKDHKTLLGQRRRWINSSLFAFLYVWKNYYFNVLESEHNCIRSYITINISMIFAGLSFINSFFTPSLYWFVLYITIAQIDTSSELCAGLATLISAIYCFVIIAAVGGSLIGKEWENHAHIVSAILSIFTFGMSGLVIYSIVGIYLDLEHLKFESFRQGAVIVMILANIGCLVVIVLVHIFTHPKFVFKLLWDFISYLSFQGAYSQTMVIYGMCNVDDVSWGTKGATGSGGVSRFFQNKVFFVSNWLFFNCVLAYILVYIDVVVPQRQGKQGGIVLLAICIYASFQLICKTILALFNFLHWIFAHKICKLKFDVPQNNVEETKRYWRKLKSKFQALVQSQSQVIRIQI